VRVAGVADVGFWAPGGRSCKNLQCCNPWLHGGNRSRRNDGNQRVYMYKLALFNAKMLCHLGERTSLVFVTVGLGHDPTTYAQNESVHVALSVFMGASSSHKDVAAFQQCSSAGKTAGTGGARGLSAGHSRTVLSLGQQPHAHHS
jgi:hypothetical protein